MFTAARLLDERCKLNLICRLESPSLAAPVAYEIVRHCALEKNEFFPGDSPEPARPADRGNGFSFRRTLVVVARAVYPNAADPHVARG